MMTVSSAAPAEEVRASLRERKKLATRRLLRRMALELAAERGFSNVTVEDIAEAAEVSTRTFFNYFPSKEAALFGTEPERLDALRERIAHAVPGESALDALHAAVASDAQAMAGEITELAGRDLAGWLRRGKEAHADPHMRAARAAQMAMVERALAEGLAQRLGTDPDRDPYPALLAATAAGVFRTCIMFWAASGGKAPLDRLISLSFQALTDGLPEDCALRHITDSVTDNVTAPVTARKDNH